MEFDRPSGTKYRVPPRTGHVCVCFNKYMVVWGGYANFSYHHEMYLPPSDIWLYDTDVGYWMKRETRGKCPPGTSGASACLVDYHMYVFAGHTEHGNVNTLHRLDLRTLEWEHVHTDSDSPSPRDKCVCWVHHNKLYVFGGFSMPLSNYLNENGEFHADRSIVGVRGWNNQLVVFDLETKTWHNPRCKGLVPSSRAAHAAAKAGAQVFLFGGRHIEERMNDLHCLDLETLTWTGPLVTPGNVPVGRSWHTFTLVSDRQMFLYGGFDQADNPLNDAWILDIVKLTWTKLDHYKNCNPHLWHTACRTREGEVVVFGGCTNNILSVEQPTEHSNEVITFLLNPLSLLRLCLHTVYKNKAKTHSDWEFLPQSLAAWLQTKNDLMLDMQKTVKEQTRDTGQSVGATCTVA
ncbi:kelch domain-containing protein 2-like [Ylistrum balloti]|uniref:kelch domain-containing protein 2-like n=1 Tax=Ylistrum balloti TaxID=509963 RepID=UPI002905A327|nr:kelch domain-containing protein 2-like [Ylistrum balloti]